jgi:catechol 2,3-dioxygenase-like lactoylglutathione lyase family enzyme
MKVVEFAFVAYPAADLTRSAAFYEGVQGLNRGTLINQAGEFWVEYEVGPHIGPRQRAVSPRLR